MAKNRREKQKLKKVMHEWKAGTLHSGSKKGPIVKDQDQALAIAFSTLEDKPAAKSHRKKRSKK